MRVFTVLYYLVREIIIIFPLYLDLFLLIFLFFYSIICHPIKIN